MSNLNEASETDADTFDPETVHILGEALDEAWGRAAAGQMNGNADYARTLVARHIVAMAKQGERDRQRLIEGALARLGL
jgi:hypothetical protein